MTQPKSLLAIIMLPILGVGVWFLFWDDSQSDAIRGNPIVAISVPELPQALQKGKEFFDTKCASCHGRNAVGVEGFGPPLVHIIYEPNHHSDGSFVLAAKNGARRHHWSYGDMPPVDGIKDSEIAVIIQYVRFLQRANGIGAQE